MPKTPPQGMPGREYDNSQFYLGWEELHRLGDKYFIYLMQVADNHGMLLITKQTGEDAATQQ